ncbi:hypothetical protein M0R19_08095 [Candidatus Pacearchaeota archaeon]|jgi:hypothetical protein|nr:hypothetical protein [Candidatus Pacearchaeota archaeon]
MKKLEWHEVRCNDWDGVIGKTIFFQISRSVEEVGYLACSYIPCGKDHNEFDSFDEAKEWCQKQLDMLISILS